MLDMDPLGVDVLLAVFGTVLALLTGVGLLSNGVVPALPAVLVGAAVPLSVAAVPGRFRDRVRGLDTWLTETRRGNVAFGLLVLAALVARVALVAAPPRVQDLAVSGMTGFGAGMVALAAVRAAGRFLNGG